MALLARECGWTLDYMLDSLTYRQALRFSEIISNRERQQLRIQAFIIAYSSGLSHGSIKTEDFMDFVDKIYDRRDAVQIQDQLNQDLRKAKDDGLPIEET